MEVSTVMFTVYGIGFFLLVICSGIIYHNEKRNYLKWYEEQEYTKEV